MVKKEGVEVGRDVAVVVNTKVKSTVNNLVMTILVLRRMDSRIY